MSCVSNLRHHHHHSHHLGRRHCRPIPPFPPPGPLPPDRSPAKQGLDRDKYSRTRTTSAFQEENKNYLHTSNNSPRTQELIYIMHLSFFIYIVRLSFYVQICTTGALLRGRRQVDWYHRRTVPRTPPVWLVPPASCYAGAARLIPLPAASMLRRFASNSRLIRA